MPSGIKIRELVVGTGLIATKGAQVVVHLRGFLRRGDVILDTRKYPQPARIELSKRECIAGVRQGIVGMRVGGHRELIISPHLGYGSKAVGTKGDPHFVPANAVLRFEVELLDVRDPGEVKPEDYPPGKHLYVFSPGEAVRSQARCQVGAYEDGRLGAILTIPVGLSWRHVRYRNIELPLHKEETQALFEEAASLPGLFPSVCLSNDCLWSDASEAANGITRDTATNTPCTTIGISEGGKWQCYYSLPETSPVYLESKLYALIARMRQTLT